jgi:hypothetical protein
MCFSDVGYQTKVSQSSGFFVCLEKQCDRIKKRNVTDGMAFSNLFFVSCCVRFLSLLDLVFMSLEYQASQIDAGTHFAQLNN